VYQVYLAINLKLLGTFPTLPIYPKGTIHE